MMIDVEEKRSTRCGEPLHNLGCFPGMGERRGGGRKRRSRTGVQPIFPTWPAVSFSFSSAFFFSFFFNIKDICARYHVGFVDRVGGNVPSVGQHFSAPTNMLRKVWLELRGGVINPHGTMIQSHLSSFCKRSTQQQQQNFLI